MKQLARYSAKAAEDGANFPEEIYYVKGKSHQQTGNGIQLFYVLFWWEEPMSMETKAPAQDPTAWSCSSCREFNQL